jgi:hypothetical protein
VDAVELCRIFNEGGYVQKAERGKLASSGMIDPKRVFSEGKWYGLVCRELAP